MIRIQSIIVASDICTDQTFSKASLFFTPVLPDQGFGNWKVQLWHSKYQILIYDFDQNFISFSHIFQV